MLNKRIIAAINIIENWTVQSIKFKKFLPIGRLDTSVKIFNRWEVDEILITDISRTNLDSEVIEKCYKKVLRNNFLPISYSGGIKDFNTVVKLFNAGFDKICFNQCVYTNRKLIEETIKSFGRQSVILRCDYIETNDGPTIFQHWSPKPLITFTEWINLIHEINPSEIILQSVTRDGMRNGLDLGITNITKYLDQFVILLGGIGQKQHIVEAFCNKHCHAVAVGNSLHHKELAYLNLKP